MTPTNNATLTESGPASGESPAGRSGRGSLAAIWVPGLVVALGAAAATVHGVYAVALASRVPAGIAWLYPLMTDGLALVAYAATARLHGRAARYAWSVVAAAAGLSGLAQAAYLAGGPTVEVAPALRFGVGAWPALAAAVVAHLLYLLATGEPSDELAVQRVQRPDVYTVRPVQPGQSVHSWSDPDPFVQPGAIDADASSHAIGRPTPSPAPARTPSPVRDRAMAAATRHAQRHGSWPTVTELAAAAEVSRGTAATALRALRARPLPLHLITDARPHGANQPDRSGPESEPPTDTETRP